MLQSITGELRSTHPARTFTDGQLFHQIVIADDQGRQTVLKELFCTDALLPQIHVGQRGTFHVWHQHLFAVTTDAGMLEDVAGVKRSLLLRDARMLALMAASMLLLPYATWVAGKRLYLVLARAGQMDDVVDRA